MYKKWRQKKPEIVNWWHGLVRKSNNRQSLSFLQTEKEVEVLIKVCLFKQKNIISNNKIN